jgi:hypothetical protein
MLIPTRLSLLSVELTPDTLERMVFRMVPFMVCSVESPKSGGVVIVVVELLELLVLWE